MSFPVTVVALDLGEIFLFLLDSGGVDTHCKRVIATTLSLSARLVPWTSLLVVLVFFGLAKEVCWVEKNCFPLDVSIEGELVDLFFLSKSFSFFLIGLFSWGHLESMSRILEEDYNNAFASPLTAFSTASFQESWFWPRLSNWARTEGFRSSWKCWILITSFGVAVGSNS